MIKIILAFAALIALTIMLFVYQNLTSPTATINNHTFNILIAKTEEERQIGLSKHSSLDKDKGMLFIFDKPSYYRFWMKDMKFSIDIIFIKDGKISKIVENAPTPKDDELNIYISQEPVDKVLEINAGISKKEKFKIGQEVDFKNIK